MLWYYAINIMGESLVNLEKYMSNKIIFDARPHDDGGKLWISEITGF